MSGHGWADGSESYRRIGDVCCVLASGGAADNWGMVVATVDDSLAQTSDADSVAPSVEAEPRPPVASFGDLPPFPGLLRHPLRSVGWLVTVGVGLVSLVVLLAIVAAIPVVNFLALGYMLEAEGRVVRSGQLRDGVPFAGALPRLGAIVLGSWLWLLVVRLVTQAAADAALVDPGDPLQLRVLVDHELGTVAKVNQIQIAIGQLPGYAHELLLALKQPQPQSLLGVLHIALYGLLFALHFFRTQIAQC